jgi:hypothetical protein
MKPASNHKHRWIILAGFCGLSVSLFFPPWIYRYNSPSGRTIERSAGYHSILSPPSFDNHSLLRELFSIPMTQADYEQMQGKIFCVKTQIEDFYGTFSESDSSPNLKRLLTDDVFQGYPINTRRTILLGIDPYFAALTRDSQDQELGRSAKEWKRNFDLQGNLPAAKEPYLNPELLKRTPFAGHALLLSLGIKPRDIYLNPAFYNLSREARRSIASMVEPQRSGGGINSQEAALDAPIDYWKEYFKNVPGLNEGKPWMKLKPRDLLLNPIFYTGDRETRYYMLSKVSPDWDSYSQGDRDATVDAPIEYWKGYFAETPTKGPSLVGTSTKGEEEIRKSILTPSGTEENPWKELKPRDIFLDPKFHTMSKEARRLVANKVWAEFGSFSKEDQDATLDAKIDYWRGYFAETATKEVPVIRPKDVFLDPDFYKLGEQSRLYIMGEICPDLKALSTDAQIYVAGISLPKWRDYFSAGPPSNLNFDAYDGLDEAMFQTQIDFKRLALQCLSIICLAIAAIVLKPPRQKGQIV